MYSGHSHGLRIPVLTKGLKSSKVGTYIKLAGRSLQRSTVDGKKDSL